MGREAIRTKMQNTTYKHSHLLMREKSNTKHQEVARELLNYPCGRNACFC